MLHAHPRHKCVNAYVFGMYLFVYLIYQKFAAKGYELWAHTLDYSGERVTIFATTTKKKNVLVCLQSNEQKGPENWLYVYTYMLNEQASGRAGERLSERERERELT